MRARQAFDTLREIGLEPLLRAAWAKIRREDGLRGTIEVALARREQDELANLIRLPLGRSDTVRIELVRLDEGLRSSAFQTGLLAVLEAGYGAMVTKRQLQEQAHARWEHWLADLRQRLPATAEAWFERIADGTTSARWVRRSYGEDPVRAAQVVLAVGRALAELPAESGGHELLAVFAARVTGDPHAFDSGTPGGRLLLHALAERFAAPQAGLSDREERAFLLDMAGLGTDQVSSTVLVANLATATVGEGEHPVVRAMAEHGGAWRLTLGEVRTWRGARARSGRAYVVENPPVFEYLLRAIGPIPVDRRPTLICTEGFLSAAAVRLLDLLAAGGAEIWYGGDFDRNGLAIASWVAGRYASCWQPWRMAPPDYLTALGGAEAPGDGLDSMPFAEPLLPTARAMASRGNAYQERLVELLLEDLLAGVK